MKRMKMIKRKAMRTIEDEHWYIRYQRKRWLVEPVPKSSYWWGLVAPVEISTVVGGITYLELYDPDGGGYVGRAILV